LLEPGERTFLRALDELGVPYLIVGVAAAVMQGAPLVTEDIDMGFGDRADHKGLAVLPALEAALAVQLDGQRR
jgi:hypothetical protein